MVLLCLSGENYTLTFTARGTDGRDLIVGIGDAGGNYHNRYGDFVHDGWLADVHVAPECFRRCMVVCSLARAECCFDMGSDVGQVDIDNVSVVSGHVGVADLTGTPTADPTDQVTDTGVDTGDTGVDTGYWIQVWIQGTDTGVDTGTDTGVDTG